MLVGWAIGAFIEVGATFRGVLLAFLPGGVILDVLKEERASRFGALVAGLAAYTLVLLAL